MVRCGLRTQILIWQNLRGFTKLEGLIIRMEIEIRIIQLKNIVFKGFLKT
jgi:hypothetical protein